MPFLLINNVFAIILLFQFANGQSPFFSSNRYFTPTAAPASKRTTALAPKTKAVSQRKAFHFNRWALPDGSAPLDCARLFANDSKYIGEMVKNRIRRKDDPTEHALDMSCGAIQSRNRFWHNAKDGPGERQEEEGHAIYSLAQIRMVYKDYVLVELELAATFSPLNWFCYVIDSASTALFKRRVRALAHCFPNVIMAHERPMDSAGVGMMEAALDCLGRLATTKRKWEYVTLLQNHDTAIKTGVQMAQIFAWMEGANDVIEEVAPEGRHDSIKGMDWSFTALNLFKNASRNSAVSSAAAARGFPAFLHLSKGGFQISLTRAMVEFIQRELNLTEFMRRINLIGYGRDETMLITLHTADQLNAPGGFTQTCRSPKNAGPTNYLTRKSIWFPPEKAANCLTGKWRHYNCIFGIEDLPRLGTFPQMFLNKFWPPFDFGAALCVYERMFNMTHLHTAKEQFDQMASVVNKTVVQQLPNVRFQRFKRDALLLRSNSRQKKQRFSTDDDDDKLLTFDETMHFRCDGGE